MKKEDMVLTEIAEWIQKQGIKILQDHKRENNISVFKIRGDLHKPDLIALSKENTAIEVKIGDKTNSLGTNSGILKYFTNYCEGKSVYFDEQNRPIKIDNFVLATRNSIRGMLKDEEKEYIDPDKDKEERRLWVKKGWYPEIEYAATHEILRSGLWQQIDRERYNNCGVGLGVLLSSILGYNPDHYNWKNKKIEKNEAIPAISVKKPMKTILVKNGGHRWGFEWKPL